MATKKEELTRGSTLRAASDDEPLFILRAQDILAPAVVRTWAAMLEIAQFVKNQETGGPLSLNQGDNQLQKVQEAIDLAEEMEHWQVVHGSKIPD